MSGSFQLFAWDKQLLNYCPSIIQWGIPIVFGYHSESTDLLTQHWMGDLEQKYLACSLKTTTNEAYSHSFNCTIILIFHIQTTENIKSKLVSFSTYALSKFATMYINNCISAKTPSKMSENAIKMVVLISIWLNHILNNYNIYYYNTSLSIVDCDSSFKYCALSLTDYIITPSNNIPILVIIFHWW